MSFVRCHCQSFGRSQYGIRSKLNIFLGTPNNENWPGILDNQSPESKNFLERKVKNYSGDSWTAKAPRLDHNGRDLLTSLLKYQNCARISARGAMRHKVFEVSFQAYGNEPFLSHFFDLYVRFHFSTVGKVKTPNKGRLHFLRNGSNKGFFKKSLVCHFDRR